MPRKQPKKNDTSTILAGTTPLSHDNNLIVADENCKPVSDEITALIDAISRDHQACTIASKSAIKHAIEAGQKIRAVRAFAGHGNWEDYFIKHIAPATGISLRTGQRYAQIADEWDLFVTNIPNGCVEGKGDFLDHNLIETFRIQRSSQHDRLRAAPNAWLTPRQILAASQATLGQICLDVCPIEEEWLDPTARLATEWCGTCWIAPGHHGDLRPWTTKAINEISAGNMCAGLLMLPLAVIAKEPLLLRFPIAVLSDRLTVSAQRIMNRKNQEPTVIWKDAVLPTQMAIAYLADTPNMDRFEKAFGDSATIFVPYVNGNKILRISSPLVEGSNPEPTESQT